jgi:LysR family nitrogen assimilation transcriptional regulator
MPLMTDLVRAGLGDTVLPSCGVRALTKSGQASANPIAGLSITWLVAIPKSRSLSFAAERFCEMLRPISRQQIDKGIWIALRT